MHPPAVNIMPTASLRWLYVSRCVAATYGARAGVLVSGWATGSWGPPQGAVNQADVTQEGKNWQSWAAIAQPWHRTLTLVHTSFGQTTHIPVCQTSQLCRFTHVPRAGGPRPAETAQGRQGGRGSRYGNWGRHLERQALLGEATA